MKQKTGHKNFETNDLLFKSYDFGFYLLSEDPNNHAFLLDVLFDNLLDNGIFDIKEEKAYFALYNHLNVKVKLDFLSKISDEQFIRFLHNINMIKSKKMFDGDLYQYCLGSFLIFVNEEAELFVKRSLCILINNNNLSLSQKETLLWTLFVFYKEKDFDSVLSSLVSSASEKRKFFVFFKNNLNLMKNVYVKKNLINRFFFDEYHYYYPFILGGKTLFKMICHFILNNYRNEINKMLLKKGGFKKLIRIYMECGILCEEFTAFQLRTIYKDGTLISTFLFKLFESIEFKKVEIKTKEEKEILVYFLSNHVDLFFSPALSKYPCLLEIVKENKILFDKFVQSFIGMIKDEFELENGELDVQKYHFYISRGSISDIGQILMLFDFLKKEHKEYFDYWGLEKYCLNKQDLINIIMENQDESIDESDNIHLSSELLKIFDFSEVEIQFILDKTTDISSFSNIYCTYLKTLNENKQIQYLTKKIHKRFLDCHFLIFFRFYEMIKAGFSHKIISEFTEFHRSYIEENLLKILNDEHQLPMNQKINYVMSNLMIGGYLYVKNENHFFDDFGYVFIENKKKIFALLKTFFNDYNLNFWFDFIYKHGSWLFAENESDWDSLKNELLEELPMSFIKKSHHNVVTISIQKWVYLNMIVDKSKYIDGSKNWYQSKWIFHSLKDELGLNLLKEF